MYRYRKIHGLIYEQGKVSRREEVQIGRLLIDEGLDIPVFDSFLQEIRPMRTVTLQAQSFSIKVYISGIRENLSMASELGVTVPVRGDYIVFRLQGGPKGERLLDLFKDQISEVADLLKRYAMFLILSVA